MGDTISLSETQIKSMFFVNRYRERKKTEEADQKAQIDYIAEYMSTQKLIKKVNNDIIILPEGLKRIDELQKNQSNSKQAFVAMSFAKEMTDIREAVRQGIEQANYMPRFMDEIEHNKQIIPEMLYEIKQSKFVVAELTGHNNGAYYEAGYAKGLGKEVIHVCRKDTFGADGHFDVAQISTVLWETEAELSERLEKRIKATIK
jgi:nucleoside 2-deoxyribosyltransferase